MTGTDDDTRITSLIVAARNFAEAYTNLRLIQQVVERSYDYWPAAEIDLDVWPLQSIDSVKYDDTASPVTEQTLVENTDYYADVVKEGGRVRTITGWPSVAVQPTAIKIRMTAGFADSGASPVDLADGVPQNIKEGIIAYVQFLFEGDCGMEGVARALLWSSRRL